MKPFFARDAAAGVLVLVTLAGAVLAEWAVTFAERGRGLSWSRKIAIGAHLLGEVTLLRTGERSARDRGTKQTLVLTLLLGIVLAALAARRLPGLAMPGGGWPPTLLGVALIWAGIGLRTWAIATLGRFFRRDIQVADDQSVVRRGPYAFVRHPAYSGNLLMCMGLGFLFGNWASLALMATLPLVGLVRRIRVEDAMLIEALGEPYREYAQTTARLVPAVW